MPLVIKGKTPRIAALDENEQSLAEALAKVMREAGKTVDWDAIATAVATLNADEIYRMIARLRTQIELESGIEDAVRDELVEIVEKAALAEARSLRSIISQTQSWGNRNTITGKKPLISYTFDVADPNVYRWAELRAAQLVTSISQTTEESIRRIILEGFKGPITGPNTAVRLRNVIGLHPRWALAVDRFSTREYERLRRAGLSHKQALASTLRSTEKYRAKLIRARAKMISRTEIMTASNNGRQMAWQQGIDGGWVEPTSMKRWSTSNTLAGGVDPKRGICEECRPMKWETVPVDRPFSNGLMMPPAHPNCRCTAYLVPPSRGLTGLPSQNMAELLDRFGSSSAEVPS